MADEIEQINRILSAPPEGTGDNVYDGAIDPREVGVEALNAGALSDEEFLMAEEFMDSLPKEAHKGFIESLIKEPRATIKSVIDTLFGGGSVEGDPNPMIGALGSIGSGSTSNAELDAYRNAINVEGSGAMTDAELDAFRKMKMNMDLNQGTGSGDPELDAIRRRQMDMNLSPDTGSGDPELDAIRRQRMSMDNR
tara:strand:+ start:326 stop:910 length:585 start_codon:yes stop_codon:yes gene_type:complete